MTDTATNTRLRPFDEILAVALRRKGGPEALQALLPSVRSGDELRAVGDDRWLSQMTKCVFQSGFNWSVIEKKWPGFEAAFDGFTPQRCAMMSDEDVDRLLKDARIVRHAKKILSVRENAAFVLELAGEHGSASACFADWPDSNYVGLLELMRSRGSRLGGATAAYVLRFMGKDAFLLGGDVAVALVREGVVAKAPSSKRDLQAVQAAFNRWREESGRPLSHISRILACSVGEDPGAPPA